jgi:hypothetical protein
MDQIILAMVWGILADFWVPHEIDSWNFQHMLDLWFSEACGICQDAPNHGQDGLVLLIPTYDLEILIYILY